MEEDNKPTWRGKAVGVVLIAIATVVAIELAGRGLMGLAGLCR